MIKIIQGTQNQINQYLFAQKNQLDQALCLYNSQTFPSGFFGVRMFIHYLEKRLGVNQVRKIIEANKAIASFIFPDLFKTLNDLEKREYYFYHASLESRLNVPYPLFEKVADFLSKIIKDHSFEIIIPKLSTIDSESLRVIENYYRHYPSNKQDLFVGFPTDMEDVVDANGIIWERYQGDIQYFVGGFMQYENSELISPLAYSNDVFPVTWNDYHDVNSEALVFNEMKDSDVLDEGKVNAILSIMNTSYERYSFRAVMAIGARLLECKVKLDPVLKAEIHCLIGSAASFYQFTHHANPPFDDYLAYHFQEALLHEKRAGIRLALYYRISFTYAERREDIDSAAKWTDQFVQEIAELELTDKQRDYHLSWAYNVRGHVYAHTNKFARAAEDAEKAFELLNSGIKKMEEEEDTLFNFWLNDYKLSIFNLTIHQVYTGDEVGELEYSKIWHKRMSYIMSFMPRIMLFDTFHWVDYHRNKFNMRAALQSAEEGINDAIAFKHGQIYIYTFCAADFNYRMGYHEKALDYFIKAEALRPLYNDLLFMFSMQWFIGNCYLQLNRWDEARAIFSNELKRNVSTDYNIQLRSKLALLSALMMRKLDAEQEMNAVIDEAVEHGEKNLLVKVATTAAVSLSCLNENELSIEAINNVLELVETSDDEVSLNKGYLFETYMQALLIKGYDENICVNCMRLIPEALNDIENWQYLPLLKNSMTIFEENNANSEMRQELKENLAIFNLALLERKEVLANGIEQLN